MKNKITEALMKMGNPSAPDITLMMTLASSLHHKYTSSVTRKMRLDAMSQKTLHVFKNSSHSGFATLKMKERLNEVAKRHAGAMKPTLSSVRDYTSKLAHYALAMGLMSEEEYVTALISPDTSGRSENIIGLFCAVDKRIVNLSSDFKLPGTSLGANPDYTDMVEILEGLLREWYLWETAAIGDDPLVESGEAAAKIVAAVDDGDSYVPETDCSGFDLRETLNVFAVHHKCELLSRDRGGWVGLTSDDAVLHKVFSQMHKLKGINKVFISSIEKLSKNNEALSKLEVDGVKLTKGEKMAINDLHRLSVEDKTTTTTTTTPEKIMKSTKYDSSKIETPLLSIINSAMSSSKMGSFEELCEEINSRIEDNTYLTEALNKARAAAAAVKMAPVSIDASTDGVVPKGETVVRTAISILDELGMEIPAKERGQFDFEVPYFVWESAHPHVPVFDVDYQWRWDILLKILWGISKNMKPWIHGHTGTGKTTLIEQACAILNWPFARINFDSEITRMDLIGNAGLETDEHGNTITKFVEGILPQMLAQPYVICGDEFDFVRSDIAYVFQRALEDKGLLLTEDAGRLIQPHPFSRIVATANTQGQGDEFGLYQGARVQSQAFLDRFQCWIEVPYLDSDKEKALVSAKVPSLPEAMIDKIIKYTCEHREAFKQAAILKPMSPRGVVAMARAISDFTSYTSTASEGVRLALESTILGSVTHADASKINELVDRTFN